MIIYRIKISFPDGTTGYMLGERRLPIEFSSPTAAQEYLHEMGITDDVIEDSNIVFEQGWRKDI